MDFGNIFKHQFFWISVL